MTYKEDLENLQGGFINKIFEDFEKIVRNFQQFSDFVMTLQNINDRFDSLFTRYMNFHLCSETSIIIFVKGFDGFHKDCRSY